MLAAEEEGCGTYFRASWFPDPGWQMCRGQRVTCSLLLAAAVHWWSLAAVRCALISCLSWCAYWLFALLTTWHFFIIIFFVCVCVWILYVECHLVLSSSHCDFLLFFYSSSLWQGDGWEVRGLGVYSWELLSVVPRSCFDWSLITSKLIQFILIKCNELIYLFTALCHALCLFDDWNKWMKLL